MNNRRPADISQSLVFEADEICHARSDRNNNHSSGGRMSYVPVTQVKEDHYHFHVNSQHKKRRRRSSEPFLPKAEFREYLRWKNTLYTGLTKEDFAKARSVGVNYEAYKWFVKKSKSTKRMMPIEFLCGAREDSNSMWESIADIDDNPLGCVNIAYRVAKLYCKWIRVQFGGEPVDRDQIKC